MNKWRLIIGLSLIMLLASCGQTTKIENVNGVSIMNITHKKGVYTYPTWSPDGQNIAFRFSGDVWIANADGTSSIQITGPKSILGRMLIWDKPKEITFLESDALKKTGENYIVNTVYLSEKGNKQIVLLENMSTITGLSWNPLNHSQLLIAVNLWTSEGESRFPLHLYDVDTGERKEIIQNGHSPKWSPNGEWISYTRGDGIYMYDVSTKKDTQIYQKEKGEAIQSLSWSPDSRWIAFRGGPSKEKVGVYILPSDGSASPEHILNFGVNHLDWSPQGDYIVFTTIGAPGVTEMYLMEVPEKFRPKLNDE